jgi:hypothetical protein
MLSIQVTRHEDGKTPLRQAVPEQLGAGRVTGSPSVISPVCCQNYLDSGKLLVLLALDGWSVVIYTTTDQFRLLQLTDFLRL